MACEPNRNQKISFIEERIFGPKQLSKKIHEESDLELIAGLLLCNDGKILNVSELPDQKIQQHYDNEHKKLLSEERIYTEGNNLSALERYMLMDAWSPNEALCLWLGLEPSESYRLLNWATQNHRISQVAADVTQRWDLIERALRDGVLSDPVSSTQFIFWASKKNRINSRLFEKELEGHQSISGLSAKIIELEDKIARQKDIIEKFELELSDPKEVTLSLMAKLFGVVCVEKLGFDEKPRSKNDLPTSIVEIMKNRGWGVTDRTVRHYIRVAISTLQRGDRELVRSSNESEHM